MGRGGERGSVATLNGGGGRGLGEARIGGSLGGIAVGEEKIYQKCSHFSRKKGIRGSGQADRKKLLSRGGAQKGRVTA